MKAILITATLLVTVILVAWALPASTQHCPSMDGFRAYRPPEATRVYAVDGSRLADLSPERRVVVELRDVPAVLSKGFVAVEDRRFYQHGGIDPRGIGRAVWRDATSLSLAEGFSTITMQLARNVFSRELPRGEKVRRKICEVRLARQIEKQYDKREILQLYLNQIYLGDGLYGVEAASHGYFGKPARELKLAEAALIIGLAKNPEGYNPRKNALRAIQRRNVVLDVMQREGVISTLQSTSARSAPVRIAPPPEAAGPAPYFVAAVRRELRERFGDGADVQGLRVRTGLDPIIQKAARDALVKQIQRIEAGAFGPYRHAAPKVEKLTPADGTGSPYLQGMVVVLDTRTGAVRALVGGRDFTHSAYDRALVARRQPGSAFKPIVFAAALQNGLTAAERIATTPVAVTDTRATWKPDDLVPDSVTSLSVRNALALSSNHAAVRVGQIAGERRVAETARALGLTTPVPPYPSIFLGSAEVIPIEFVAAYATLGNGGQRVQPRLITSVEDARGNVLWEASPATDQVIDPGVAFLTVSMMEDVLDHGTGSAIRRAGFWQPAAGKTGTTNDARDVWFVGMTAELAAGVWLGFDHPKSILPNASGGRLAAPVWAQLMIATYAKRAANQPWSPPANVLSIPIDTTTGHLAGPGCTPEAVRIEYFIEGTEPREYCAMHGGERKNVLEKVLRGLRKIF